MRRNTGPSKTNHAPYDKREAQDRFASEGIQSPSDDPKAAQATEKEHGADQQDLSFWHLHTRFQNATLNAVIPPYASDQPMMVLINF